MTLEKRARLSLLKEASVNTAVRSKPELTNENFAIFAESLVNFERTRSGCRSSAAASDQDSPAIQPSSLEDLKAISVAIVIKSE